MCKVSIIVPIYKVEQYLDRCISSIFAQTFQDYELILVDDGSPDNCGKMCDDYALKDKRVKVVHKENGGLADARNAGLDIATGEYILFCDSDDFVPSWMVHHLHKAKQDSKDLWITKGVAHGMSFKTYPKEYEQRIRRFVKK